VSPTRTANPEISGMIERLEPDLVAMRRDLHRYPELAFAEERTASIAAERLRALGMTPQEGVGGTGVFADLSGPEGGPVLLIRADMDALPITETIDQGFASQTPGAMHACGHDVHVAAALGAATVLTELTEDLGGTVRFCFQPAEEILAGAERMIADGAMEGVDLVLVAHVLSMAPYGTVVAVPGPFLSGADFFELRVIGKAGHGGMPHLSVDPVYAAAQIVSALQSIVSRETKPGETLVVSVNAIEGGTGANIVSEEVVLRGNVRWFSEGVRQRVLERIPGIAGAIGEGLGARTAFSVQASAPVTRNDPVLVGRVQAAVRETGRAVTVDTGMITASDDAARFIERVPGAFVGIGAGGPGWAPHHHHRFEVDERAVGLMSEVLVRAALRMLGPG